MLADLVDGGGGKIAEREGAVSNADEARHLQPQMFQHAAHLAVLALGQLHLDPAIAAGPPFEIGVDRAIADAVDLDALDQLLELRLADLAEHAGAVGALNAGGGEFELAFQPAVAGEEE